MGWSAKSGAARSKKDVPSQRLDPIRFIKTTIAPHIPDVRT
jgi:hypothetical protein